jgi:urease accessory protein
VTAVSTSAALLQLASPALPIGAFSYSSGLEMAIELGWVHDVETAQRWITGQLNETVLCWEIPLWGQLFQAWQTDDAQAIAAHNAQAIAARETAELRAEHTQMGYALARWCRDVLPLTTAQRETLGALDQVSVLTVHALAAVASPLPAAQGALAYAFGFVENQIVVLAKALPMGQTDAQRMLRRVTSSLADEVMQSLARPAQAWSSAAPLAAIASMKHETQYTRLFRS